MKRLIFVFAFFLLVCAGAFAQFGLSQKLQGNSNASDNQDGKLSSIKNMFTDAGKLLKGVGGIGLKEELTIGNSVAVQIVSKYGGLVRDPAITRRVNLVGKSLAYYCDRSDLNFRFGVLNSPTINAFSTPGGYVFITRGLYDLVQNNDQLAGVLAHEITHVTRKHALKIIERGQFFDGITGLALDAGTATKKPDLTRYSKGVNQITTTLFEKGFDPQTEFDADKGGFTLAATVGYAPNGLEQCLQTLLRQHEASKPAIFPTHPPLDKRIEKLELYQAGGL